MVEDFGDDLVHVVVLVFRQTAAEADVLFLGGESLVLLGEGVVAVVVDGIVGFRALVPLLRILVADHGVGLFAELKMLVFDDAGVWHGGIGIIEYCVALEVLDAFHQLVVEADGAELQLAELVAEVGIQRTGVKHTVGHSEVFLFFGKEVLSQTHLDAVEQTLENLSVTADGDTLMGVVEVVVVEGEAQRQTA